MKKFSKEWIDQIFRMIGKCKNSRTKEILLSLGFVKTFKIINVVGTNGKGSVAKYINDALIEQGYKVGKFTSPHLRKYNERITINNKEISNNDFFNIVNPNIDIYNDESIMFFPLTYIVAMIYFWKNNVDYVILEAGIGGLEDPTNVINGDYGVLTSIAEDHMDWFKTRKNISIDKAGIINRNMIFVLPNVLDDFSKKVFKEKIKEKNASLIEVNNKGKTYQIRNQKLALALFKEITNENIKEFFEPFGRTTIKKEGLINKIFDVAHNYEGIHQTYLLLKENNIEYDKVVISLSDSKDDSHMYELFWDKDIYIFKHSGFRAKKIKDYTKEYNFILKDINDIENIKVKKGILFIGSFFFINDLLEARYEKFF